MSEWKYKGVITEGDNKDKWKVTEVSSPSARETHLPYWSKRKAGKYEL